MIGYCFRYGKPKIFILLNLYICDEDQETGTSLSDKIFVGIHRVIVCVQIWTIFLFVKHSNRVLKLWLITSTLRGHFSSLQATWKGDWCDRMSIALPGFGS